MATISTKEDLRFRLDRNSEDVALRLWVSLDNIGALSFLSS